MSEGVTVVTGRLSAKEVKLEPVRVDGGTQMRAGLDLQTWWRRVWERCFSRLMRGASSRR